MDEDLKEKARKLEALEQQLESVRAQIPQIQSSAKLPGDAARSAIDFASATAVGTVLGYGFDRWQDTLPWGLLIGLVMGTAAGLKLMFDEEARQRRRQSSDDKKY